MELITIYYLAMDAGDGSSYVDFFYDKEVAEYHEEKNICECQLDGSYGTLEIPKGAISPDIYTSESYIEEFWEGNEEDEEKEKEKLRKEIFGN